MDSLTKLAAVADRLTALPLNIREREAVLKPLKRAQLETVALILATRITVMRERHGIISGEEIRQLRDARGWTQRELAARLGVAPNSVARWERGEMGTAPEIARQIHLL